MTWTFLSYLFSLLTVGANGIIAHHIDLPSSQIVVLRAWIGAAALFFFYMLRHSSPIFLNPRQFTFRILAGVSLGMEWLFVYEAYRLSGVSVATLAYYCGPAIAMALSPVLFHERLTTRKAASFSIVLAGIVMIDSAALSEGQFDFGLFCGLMSAVMFAATLMLNKKGGPVQGIGEAAIPLAVSGAIAFLAVLFKTGGMDPISGASLPWVLFLGFISTALGCGLYFRAVSRLPMQTAALWGYLDPLAAVIMAAFFLGEQLTLLQWAGAACILGGALWGNEIPPSGAKQPATLSDVRPK